MLKIISPPPSSKGTSPQSSNARVTLVKSSGRRTCWPELDPPSPPLLPPPPHSCPLFSILGSSALKLKAPELSKQLKFRRKFSSYSPLPLLVFSFLSCPLLLMYQVFSRQASHRSLPFNLTSSATSRSEKFKMNFIEFT